MVKFIPINPISRAGIAVWIVRKSPISVVVGKWFWRSGFEREVRQKKKSINQRSVKSQSKRRDPLGYQYP